jgi:hypothetical protein
MPNEVLIGTCTTLGTCTMIDTCTIGMDSELESCERLPFSRTSSFFLCL